MYLIKKLCVFFATSVLSFLNHADTEGMEFHGELHFDSVKLHALRASMVIFKKPSVTEDANFIGKSLKRETTCSPYPW